MSGKKIDVDALKKRCRQSERESKIEGQATVEVATGDVDLLLEAWQREKKRQASGVLQRRLNCWWSDILAGISVRSVGTLPAMLLAIAILLIIAIGTSLQEVILMLLGASIPVVGAALWHAGKYFAMDRDERRRKG